MRGSRIAIGIALAALACPFGATGAEAQFFNAVFSRDGLDVVAVGDSGALYRSFDGGSNWTSLKLGARPLRGVTAHGFTIVAVGDSGKIWRSVDNGGGWALQVVAGTPALRAVETLSGDSLVAVGAGGRVLLSTDGGASWGSQTSGTLSQINAVRFRDDRSGWIAGAGGFLAKTIDGGANWTPVPLGTANDLEAVDALGPTVWAVGDNATAFRSLDGGAGWTQLDLHADLGPDVRAVWVESADTVYVAGGGGFIRRSVDGGATWQFLVHELTGQVSDLWFVGPNGWAASNKVRAVMRTSDRGDRWSMPTGAVTTRMWVQKVAFAGSMRGATIAVNPILKHEYYCMLGRQLWRSWNEGENWIAVSTVPNAATFKSNAFVISPHDTNTFIAAVGPPDRIVRSTNGGASWDSIFAKDFGEYGIPLEMDPDRPDTLYFGVDSGVLYRSIDRGASFQPWSTTVFRSPCDIVAVPESDSAVILVGDGVTSSAQGKLYRSTGLSPAFTEQVTVAGSEIPGMACSRLRHERTFATNWSTGGVERTPDFGLTWPRVHTVGSSWGVEIAKDDPNLVIFGLYTGGITYFSFVGGDSNGFASQNQVLIGGSNYALFARDRGTIFAEQSNGIHKLSTTQTMPTSNTQSLALAAPDGGEVWNAGSVHDISWSATNVALARIEYRRSAPDAWQPVAFVAGYLGRYAWTVPFDATTDARIRVSDAWDASPTDASSAAFTIALPILAESPASLAFGTHSVGSTTLDTVRVTNSGTGAITFSSIATAGSAFRPGRASLVLAPGASDTIGVTFRPQVALSFADTLVLTSNAVNTPVVRVPLSGAGADTLRLALLVPDGGEAWPYGSSHAITWESTLVTDVDLDYQIVPSGAWVSIADSVAAGPGSFAWQVPFTPAAQARVRVRQHGGMARDSSALGFTILGSSLALSPSVLDLGSAVVHTAKSDTFHLENPGTAPLTISAIACSRSTFSPGRTSITIPPGGTDTLGVHFLPTTAGADSAWLTFTTNVGGPPGTRTFRVEGLTTVLVTGTGLPAAFALLPNRPNPFEGTTLIRYALPQRAHVTIDVFTLNGQLVATLVDEDQDAGTHAVPFGPGVVPNSGWRIGEIRSGVYFCRLRAGSFSATRKMLLMR